MTFNKSLIVAYSLPSALLVFSAIAHRLQFNTAIYTESWLISAEFALLILLIAGCLLLFPAGLVALWQRQWWRLATIGAAYATVLLGILIAVTIDAPTLLYMT